jgi:hypothetical protein
MDVEFDNPYRGGINLNKNTIVPSQNIIMGLDSLFWLDCHRDFKTKIAF